jgi:Flp pilus assembly protein CpaB
MKRNLVPLLGIAFVVAVASTGIFYGLLNGKLQSSAAPAKYTIVLAAKALPSGTVLTAEDVRTGPWQGDQPPKGILTSRQSAAGRVLLQSLEEGEALVESKLVSRNPSVERGEGVPAGLRAMSVRVSDSTGVLKMLQPGHRVDVHVVQVKGENNKDTEARTLLENVPVLAVSPPENPLPNNAAVVTLLVAPREVESLAVADAAARIRLTLRNPTDSEHLGTGGSNLQEVLKGQRRVATPAHELISQNGSGPRVALAVTLAGISSGGLEELAGATSQSASTGSLQVSSFRAAGDPTKAIARMREKNELDVVSQAQLETRPNRVVSVSQGESRSDYGVKVRFVPYVTAKGKLRLRVLPEYRAGAAGRAVETDIELVDGQSFLVRGLVPDEDRGSVWGRLFPAHAKENAGRDLIVMVSPKLVAERAN